MTKTDSNSKVIARAGQARGDDASRRGWWPFIAAASTLVVLIAGTNIPSPLYPLYEHLFGFPPLIVTLVFAVYAIVLIPSLLVFGRCQTRSAGAGC